jgi:hypothetical protein
MTIALVMSSSKKYFIKIFIQRKNSACPKTAKVRKKASKGAKRRLHSGKRRPHGAKRRQSAHFGVFWRLLANWEKT